MVSNTDSVISIPLYIKVADGFISQIESGELLPGAQLPPERELSANLGINRMTLRRSLNVLQSQGFVIRKHGIGTFIAEPKIDRKMDTVFRFSRGMLDRGFTPKAELISIHTTYPDSKAAEELDLPITARIFRVVRLRSINNEPVMIESYLIPVDRFPELENYDLEKRSIYEIMESQYGIEIVRAKQSFEPVLSTEFESNLLNIPIGEAMMMEKRISFDHENIPVEVGKDLYRGDRFRFVTETAPVNGLPESDNPRTAQFTK